MTDLDTLIKQVQLILASKLYLEVYNDKTLSLQIPDDRLEQEKHNKNDSVCDLPVEREGAS